jgi:hypothetical protein
MVSVANPDDLRKPRSIRRNNPGALDFAAWQKARIGYVGISQPDDSPAHNITTIYRTPEDGIGAWYHLIAKVYNFPGGNFTLADLATRYAGSNNASTTEAYVKGWTHWFSTPISPNAHILTSDKDSMVKLAKAMFSYEAGAATPLHEEQITYAIGREMAGTLPA